MTESTWGPSEESYSYFHNLVSFPCLETVRMQWPLICVKPILKNHARPYMILCIRKSVLLLYLACRFGGM